VLVTDRISDKRRALSSLETTCMLFSPAKIYIFNFENISVTYARW
jgi:hypothetical protein